MMLAKENGLVSIAVLGGHKSKKELQKVNPDFLLNSIKELISLFQIQKSD